MLRFKGIIIPLLLTLVCACILYLAAAFIGSAWTRNSEWSEPDNGVAIMVETNGLHTAIVMPLVTREKDWRADFPVQHLRQSNRDYTHVSVSWGEKQVFLTAQDWSDLTPSAAIGAITGGEALLHVAHYVRPAPSPDHRSLTISSEQYRKLVASIEPFVAREDVATRYPGYGGQDVFYETQGTYTAFMTCNQWTADRLADAGVRTATWSPFAGGVMQHVPQP